jgi:hypothetical protein
VAASLPVSAAPFVVSDPLDPRATSCGVLLDAAAKVTIPVTTQGTDKICKYDISGVSVGAHTIRMTTIANDPVWGSQESVPSAPLSFARPSGVSAPAGLELQP